MAYYQTCPKCGSHLDPGEKCDCAEVWREVDREVHPLTRDTLDYCGGDLQAARAWVMKHCEEYERETGRYIAPYIKQKYLEGVEYWAKKRGTGNNG